MRANKIDLLISIRKTINFIDLNSWGPDKFWSPVMLSQKFVVTFLVSFIAIFVFSDTGIASTRFEDLLEKNSAFIKKSSSKTVEPVLTKIKEFGGPVATRFLKNWKAKKIFLVKSTGKFVVGAPTVKNGKKMVTIFSIATNKELSVNPARNLKQLKPNSGVRARIASSLVPLQLLSGSLDERREGIETVERKVERSHIAPLRDAMKRESNNILKKRLAKVFAYGTIAFSSDNNQVKAAIQSLYEDLSIGTRAALNPLLSETTDVAATLPPNVNIARVIIPNKSIRNWDGSVQKTNTFWKRTPELNTITAYSLLVEKNLAPRPVSSKIRDAKIISFAKDGIVAGVRLSSLNNEASRDAVYDWLAKNKGLPARVDEEQMSAIIAKYVFFARYNHSSKEVVQTAIKALTNINRKVAFFQFLDLLLDGISLVSIYFLAAIGLAITFGVMRVINMAHGEFIMIGAYTGYVTQLFVPNYTISILIAIPAAFVVTFLAGIILERAVIRHLYKRPLETLLATFGISIALQQVAKNIFGTQARPLTSPEWLDGALVINDVLAISNIRIAIFALGLVFFGLILFVMTKTRFGLETRAVTQNPTMAASMGINPERINMLTFGFGSGIAGIAGIAIGLFSKVTSELGSDYIVQSFMTVVVGGVGNIWGTLAGATMIGLLQKGIEWFNPSNTLAAQTYMVVFIILFIQFRPKGIIALKGRAAEF